MRKTSIGRRSKNNISKVRQIVYDRDNNRCIASGFLAGAKGCHGTLTIQHSVTRGMGGSALWDGPEYLRAMCAFHNTLETSDADFHDLCVENGWSIPRWLAESMPTDLIPVRYIDGWYILVGESRHSLPDELVEKLKKDINA